MNYHEYDPVGLFGGYVKKCWSLSADRNHDAQLIIPDGCVEVIFNFGDLIQKKICNKEWEIQPRFFLSGQLTRSITLSFLGKVDIFAIRFWPHSFANLVPWSMAESRDLDIPINDIWRNNLTDPMWGMKHFGERIAVVRDFIFRNAIPKINSFKRFERLFTTRCASARNFHKADLQGISLRQFQRDFKQFVGLSPDEYFRIQRFNRTYNAIQTGQRALVDVVQDNGYFDQSHFYKDLKKYVGAANEDFHLTMNTIITQD